jgi:hypothetical protein
VNQNENPGDPISDRTQSHTDASNPMPTEFRTDGVSAGLRLRPRGGTTTDDRERGHGCRMCSESVFHRHAGQRGRFTDQGPSSACGVAPLPGRVSRERSVATPACTNHPSFEGRGTGGRGAASAAPVGQSCTERPARCSAAVGRGEAVSLTESPGGRVGRGRRGSGASHRSAPGPAEQARKQAPRPCYN